MRLTSTEMTTVLAATLLLACRQQVPAQPPGTLSRGQTQTTTARSSAIEIPGAVVLASYTVSDSLIIVLYAMGTEKVISLEELIGHERDGVPITNIMDTLLYRRGDDLAGIRRCASAGKPVWLPIAPDDRIIAKLPACTIHSKNELRRTRLDGPIECPVDMDPETDEP